MDKHTIHRLTDAAIHILYKEHIKWPARDHSASYKVTLAALDREQEEGVEMYRNDAVFRAKVMYSVARIREALEAQHGG